MQIRTASQNQVKLWRKLLMGKYRKKEGLFIAEGERCVEQIMKGKVLDVVALIVDEDFEPGSEILIYRELLVRVRSEDFLSISDTETPQGIIAVCKIPVPAKVDDFRPKKGVIVAMDAVQDPGNVGTIIRTASWFGAAGIVFGEGTADPFHPKVVRSTAGATGALPFVKGSLENLLPGFEKNGWKVYLMEGSEKAEDLNMVSAAEKSIMVIGNEGSGISDAIYTGDRTKVRIPGNHQNVESLNAAIALGIGLYHFRKQT
ncbi:RNA methyltransferase [soil metagenome]